MSTKLASLLLLLTVPVANATDPGRPPRRGGMAVAVEVGGGGLVSRLNPRLTSDDPNYPDIDFHTATGVTVEAGWSFIGVYYTYMEYKSSQANLDASSVGLRFTMRFRKWRPVP